jgi:SAM-dependent methyltransferase
MHDARQRRIFFDVHSDLPREAPGSDASTARALEIVGDVRGGGLVLDVACGPGMQTLALARGLPAARVVALDLHAPYLAELRRRAKVLACADRVHPVQADMNVMPFVSPAFDLVWCEGGAYLVGVDRALAQWRGLLRSGGRIALTDAVWLSDDPPEPVRAFWREYPGMTSLAGLRARVREAGLELVGDFVLPESDWWDGYYAPLARRIESLRSRHTGDAVAQAVLDECQAEIDLYRHHADCYGYAFVVAGR